MRKVILLITFILMLIMSGCTVADYKANREQFMNDCKLDTECIQYVIEDADEVIKQTPAYLELQAELQEHEDRINSLEELTEAEYIRYMTDKYLEFMGNNDACGIPISANLIKDVDGNFDAEITIFNKSSNCTFDESMIKTVLEGLQVDLPNYTITNVDFTN